MDLGLLVVALVVVLMRVRGDALLVGIVALVLVVLANVAVLVVLVVVLVAKLQGTRECLAVAQRDVAVNEDALLGLRDAHEVALAELLPGEVLRDALVLLDLGLTLKKHKKST